MKRRHAPDPPTLFLEIGARQPESVPAPTQAQAQSATNPPNSKVPLWMNSSKNPIVSWIKSSTPRLPAYTQLAQQLSREAGFGGLTTNHLNEGSSKLAIQLAQDFARDQRLTQEEIGVLVGDVQIAARDAVQLLFEYHPKQP